MKLTAKDIAYNGIIAAFYVVLTLITYPISFLGIQLRIAEVMVLLCFFRKDYIIGLVSGCAIANLMSSIGLIDVLFGTAATLLACLVIIFCKQLFVAALIPVISNAFIVGLELFLFIGDNPYFIYVGMVAIGEFCAMVIGYIFFIALRNNTKFLKLIRANQNIAFKI